MSLSCFSNDGDLAEKCSLALWWFLRSFLPSQMSQTSVQQHFVLCSLCSNVPCTESISLRVFPFKPSQLKHLRHCYRRRLKAPVLLCKWKINHAYYVQLTTLHKVFKSCFICREECICWLSGTHLLEHRCYLLCWHKPLPSPGSMVNSLFQLYHIQKIFTTCVCG